MRIRRWATDASAETANAGSSMIQMFIATTKETINKGPASISNQYNCAVKQNERGFEANLYHLLLLCVYNILVMLPTHLAYINFQ